MGLLWGTNVPLKNGDVIVLYSKDGSEAQNGFLAADTAGTFGTSDEKLLVAPPGRTTNGEVTYPPAFQSRCMFRVDSGHTEREDILYGQPIMLVHVATDMYLTAANKVQCLPTLRLPPSAHSESTAQNIYIHILVGLHLGLLYVK